jgi:hypothetical protein
MRLAVAARMAGGTSGRSQDKLRMQIRLVQVIFRAEMRRLDLSPGTPERENHVRDLRSRSNAILDAVRAQLDGGHSWHAEVWALIREVEDELGRTGINDGTL